ncbi:MAG TPA: NTP transferase domain-containing protein [Solirubrobacteraceae bacterium]|nr:NTP transferase domain-containing protein [Solirubrobacteraceae bacterium]
MREPVGVILAGGRGRRLGGAKATVRLAGAPLLDRPLSALREALGPAAAVAVVAKGDTALPDRPGTAVWREPDSPRHPLAGLVCALERAGGRPVLLCPVDLPFVTVKTLARLATVPAGPSAVAVLACGPDSGLQPLLGRWEPGALTGLQQALMRAPLPAMRALAAGLGAVSVAVPEAELANVNTPADLAAAQARLAGG